MLPMPQPTAGERRDERWRCSADSRHPWPRAPSAAAGRLQRGQSTPAACSAPCVRARETVHAMQQRQTAIRSFSRPVPWFAAPVLLRYAKNVLQRVAQLLEQPVAHGLIGHVFQRGGGKAICAQGTGDLLGDSARAGSKERIGVALTGGG